MIEKQINEEIVAAHLEPVLARDESEANTELQQEVPQMCQ